MSRLAAGLALVGVFAFANLAAAQTWTLSPGESWSIPQGVTNAAGLEQAYIVIVPYTGRNVSQTATIVLARDGQAAPDAPFSVTLPAETTALGRRTVVPIHTRVGYRPEDVVNGQPQLWSGKVTCVELCTVQLEQHPANPSTFFSGMRSINAIPQTVPPDAK